MRLTHIRKQIGDHPWMHLGTLQKLGHHYHND
jgi:hypothetical protein